MFGNKVLKRAFVAVSFLLLAACTTADYRYTNYSSSNFIAQNSRAVNSISEQLLMRYQNSTVSISPIIVTPVVNIEDLHQRSLFGRLVTEHISARFTQLKYNLVAFEFGKEVWAKGDQGELILSPELQEAVNSLNAQAVVVGTYADNGNDVFINLKVVDPKTTVVLGAHSYAIPKAPNVSDMLSEEMDVY